MKTKIFNLIILDESGSMSVIKQQAVNGVNETLQTIRAAQAKHGEQEHYVSFVTFNGEAVKTICRCIPAAEVVDIAPSQYMPSCSTPLYDAMGQSLNELRKKVAPDDKVLVTVITDGEENSSTEYGGKAIKALIDELKAQGWVFVYIGANQDVEKVAAAISITNVMSFDASPEGTTSMMKHVNKKRALFFDRLACCDADMDEENKHFFD